VSWLLTSFIDRSGRVEYIEIRRINHDNWNDRL
jgi:hypothetical protein